MMNALLTGTVTTIDQKIAEWFNNNFSSTPLPDGEWSYGNFVLCIIAILLSLLLCGMVGFERERRGRSAGLRTHLLVGVGSCIIMIISIYGFPLSAQQRDVARLAAQVITGIGFLGAGAIMHTKGNIRGLTTASTIWLVMAIGIACGSMNFVLAIASTLVVMIILTVFRRFETKMRKASPYFVLLAPADQPLITKMMEIAEAHNWTLSNMVTRAAEDGGGKSCLEVIFSVTAKDRSELPGNEVMAALDQQLTIISIQQIEH